jgi:aminopeptidase-like protein
MTLADVASTARARALADEMYELIRRLYPICRSITGNGVRETLRIVQEHITLTVHEIPTGTPVFDWTVPREWNVRDVYIKDPRGERVLDFARSNLHVVGYSAPIHDTFPLGELKKHVFTLPDRPDWIPYRTSYYTESWGLCMSHRQLQELREDEYEVCIDSTLQDGSLTLAECRVPGKRPEEILVSSHICHPSLCNDNLSGVALSTFLAKTVETLSPRYSYRFLFVPGTIGPITWLCLNRDRIPDIKHGLVLAGVGDAGQCTYKKSRRGNTDIDRAMQHVLAHSGSTHEILEFSPYGYDERQYGSPAFDLPIGCFMRTPFGRYPQYHTSADDLTFVRPESLADSFVQCMTAFSVLENDQRFMNLKPECEPQLGRRGLYNFIGGTPEGETARMALLWVLNLSDGHHSLLDITERSGMPFAAIHNAASLLQTQGLLAEHFPDPCPDHPLGSR